MAKHGGPMPTPVQWRHDARGQGLSSPGGRTRTSQKAGAARRQPTRDVRRAVRKRSRLAQVPALTFGAAVVAALLLGWQNSEEGHLTPESGVGYWLGIVGAGAMLLLLCYPLRKRVQGLRGLGSVSGWFRLHMVLGVIGPALILFHSNFKLGSLNSNVALLSMLTVAASGLIGRYLYSRVHLGLYGQRAKIEELLTDVDNLKTTIEGGVLVPDAMHTALDAFAKRAVAGRSSATSSFFVLLELRLRSFRQRARLTREVEQHIHVEGKRCAWSWRMRRKRSREVRTLLAEYFAAVNRAAAFAFYERLFALWHVLHMPLFILLVLAAIVHVVAVHLY